MKVWRWILIIAIVIAAGVGGYLLWQRYRPGQTKAVQYNTAAVTRANLVVTVAGAGSIQAHKQINLVFGAAGRVTEVLILPGDKVTANQPLLRLDPTDLQANVAKAKLGLATTQEQLRKLKVGSSAADIAAAKASIKSAEENLAGVKAGATAADMATAKAALATAQENLRTLYAGPTAADLQQAQLNLDQAKNSLWSTQSSRDATKGNPNSSQAARNSADASVLNAEIAVKKAEMALEALKQPTTTAAQVQDAQAKIEQAKANITKLEQSPTAADVANAESQLAQAQAKLDTLNQGPSAEDLAIAQAQVDQAQLSLDQAQEQLNNAVLVAPFDGVILSVAVNIGDWVANTTVVGVLADLSQLEVQAPLSELDIVRVSKGMSATVQIDALSSVSSGNGGGAAGGSGGGGGGGGFAAAGGQLRGHVERLAPAAQIAQGVANYPVLIVVDTKNAQVRPGMSAAITIVADRRQNVLTVPNRAVRSRGVDRVVAILNNGVLEWVTVKVGASNDTMTEILDGLQEKQLVVVNPPNPPRVGGQGGPGGFGPGVVPGSAPGGFGRD